MDGTEGRRVIATGRAGEGRHFAVATTTLFTCLHADSTAEVRPEQQLATRQFFWFLDGTGDELRERCRHDLQLPQTRE